MKKKLLMFFLMIFSLSFADNGKIDLLNSAKKRELKNQIYSKNKIYRVYSKPYIGTAINFGENEKILSYVVGDNQFWGVVANGRQLILNPAEEDLETSLFVTTSRGEYYFELRSSIEDIYNPVVNFLYPEDVTKMRKVELEQQNLEIPLAISKVEDMNFNYDWKKNYSWSPTQVMDDGERTYIYLSLEDKDIPSFYFEKNGEANIFIPIVITNENRQKVMVINKVFKKGVLALHKKRITITNKNRR